MDYLTTFGGLLMTYIMISLVNKEVQVTMAEPIRIRAGVILTENSTLPYDMRNVRPALEVGYAVALADHNVQYETIWIAYDNLCKQWNALGHATLLSLVDKVDVIIGPGCSDDMIIVGELTTFFQVPMLTGAGELVDTTFLYPYLIRFSFNTYSLWRIFLQMMDFYKWTNIVLIRDCCDYPKNTTTRGLINILADRNVEPFEVHFKTGSVTNTSIMISYLKEASKYGRIFVLSMDSLLLRKFMIQAHRLKMCEGEYAFFALDLYMDDIIGIGKNGWEQHDGLDDEARHAYMSLFILTLMDKRSVRAYRKFERDVNQQATKYYPHHKVDINYHTSAFHDSVIMFAVNANMTVSEGLNISKANILPLTQRFWGLVFEGGASGRVYIDPWGDRSDDHSLYHMNNEDDAEFVVVANYFGYRKAYEEVSNITWPGVNASVPLNRPLCGYQHEEAFCQPKRQPITEITIGISFGILVLVGVVGMFVYRKIKEDAALSSMDWLASWNEVLFSKNPAASGSKASLNTINSRVNTPDNLKAALPALRAAVIDGHHGREASMVSTSATNELRTVSAIFRGNSVLVRECEKHKIELNHQLLIEVRNVRVTNHENLLRFVGAIIGPEKTAVLNEMCSKGNLQNLLLNDAIKLDSLFKNSLINDIIKGMVYLHGSPIGVHRRLTSRCCWIDSRFVLKIGDYGLATFYERTIGLTADNYYFTQLMWTAPEVIQDASEGSQEADVYSFGIILQEIVTREEPFSMHHLGAEEIIRRILKEQDPAFRPKVGETEAPGQLLKLMRQCWAQLPSERPRFTDIRALMREMSKSDGQQGNIMDALLQRMESYAENLEKIVEEKTQAFLEEKRKSDQLLNQLLPPSVAEQLKKGQGVHPETYESVTVYFSDIVGFTSLSSESSPMQIVDLLNDLYTCFDNVILLHDVYKVETIGDSYMCVSGLPIRNGTAHSLHIARMALMLLNEVKSFKIRHRPEEKLKLRIGCHSGPCAAGVVGLTMPRYCLFGDTVNTASRMESTGEPLKIQISSITKTFLDGFQSFIMEERGTTAVKGKGQVQTFWLIAEK